MQSCSVRSCINYGKNDTNIDLYPLPVNNEEKILWARAFGLTVFDLRNASTRICGAHFKRKYFLGNKPEINQNVNGSAPLLMLNTSSATSNQLFSKFINTSSTTFPTFMALKNNQEHNSYSIHIPDRFDVSFNFLFLELILSVITLYCGKYFKRFEFSF